MSERLETLKNVELFKELTDNELKEISDILEERHYANEDTIIQMNEPGATMYLIVEGGVNIYFQQQHEGEFMLRHLKSGSHFGEMSLFDDKPRSALVKAVGETRIFSVDKEELFNLIYREKDLGIKILTVITRELCNRLRFTSRDLYISMGVGSRTLTQDEIDLLKDELLQSKK